VYSGKTSADGAHPWHAHIEVADNEDFSKLCGGTLIRENVVLTGNIS
jgi:Trypsin